MSYRFNEGSLELPDDWHDETMNIFKSSPSEGYNLVISRDHIPRSVEPQAHVEQQILAIEENLPEYSEVNRQTVELDGLACTWLEYTWKSPQGLMNQINVLRVVGQMLVSFTLTSTKGFNDKQRTLFAQVLGTYRSEA